MRWFMLVLSVFLVGTIACGDGGREGCDPDDCYCNNPPAHFCAGPRNAWSATFDFCEPSPADTQCENGCDEETGLCVE